MKRMAAEIRRAEPADVETLGALHSGCWRELYPTVLPAAVLDELSPAMMSGLWAKFVARGGAYEQYVAEVDGAVVAFAGIGPGREPGYEEAVELYFLYVHPEYRRKGIARQLLKTVQAHYTWLWAGNRPAQQFYKKAKFYPDSVAREGSLFGAPLEEERFSG
ncbi:GNAT family N-acetyltransferase [Glaciihabitans arcticus]|uniref:GNAT family N-acetyltransferase n=2 Tax=Glaciihabitans arcticus TaxID=2668039 RepID=A0A4Q9GTA0_9MICO|nr:GNAT family N-acetyltransferase [Glaciihabitans arcticus]